MPLAKVRSIIITAQVDVYEGDTLTGRGEAKPTLICEKDFERPLKEILAERGILSPKLEEVPSADPPPTEG